MGKLHEVLAVEGELAGVFKKTLDEAKVTFDKKANLFEGRDQRVEMRDEHRKMEEGTTHQEITETVPSKLAYVSQHVVNFLDCNLQKESANQRAVADLVLEDGTVLGQGLPATYLLGLETKLKSVREMLDAIPTLPPGFTWTADTGAKLPGVFRRNEVEERVRTEKIIKPVVLAPPTDKHPAQVEKISVDDPIGKVTTVHFSGMISPHDKSVLLGRCDALLRAVKQARQRANGVEVPEAKVGGRLMNFILSGN